MFILLKKLELWAHFLINLYLSLHMNQIHKNLLMMIIRIINFIMKIAKFIINIIIIIIIITINKKDLTIHFHLFLIIPLLHHQLIIPLNPIYFISPFKLILIIFLI